MVQNHPSLVDLIDGTESPLVDWLLFSWLDLWCRIMCCCLVDDKWCFLLDCYWWGDDHLLIVCLFFSLKKNNWIWWYGTTHVVLFGFDEWCFCWIVVEGECHHLLISCFFIFMIELNLMLSSGLWEYWGTFLFVGFGWFGCEFIRIWVMVEMMGFGV